MNAQTKLAAHVSSRLPRQVSQAIWIATTVPALATLAAHAYGSGWTPVIAGCCVGLAAALYTLSVLGANTREVAHITEALNRAASGDLTAAIEGDHPGSTELARSAASLLALLKETVALLSTGSAAMLSGTRELREVSDTMASTAEVTATRAAAVSVAASQVSASAHRVATATEEFHATTRDVAAHAA